jgi:hypothetical protein
MFKYLFKALLNDGTVIEQTQEDKSPTTEGKNTFYDVLQNMDKLRVFALYHQETGAEYLIDLKDAHFEVNQSPLFLHDEEVKNIRLIYFRRNMAIVNVTTQEVSQNVASYHFGFQANTLNGENVQKVMVLV